MDFFKNITLLFLSGFVWISAVVLLMSLWWGISELEAWYLLLISITSMVILLSAYLAKYYPRWQAALENPFGLLGN